MNTMCLHSEKGWKIGDKFPVHKPLLQLVDIRGVSLSQNHEIKNVILHLTENHVMQSMYLISKIQAKEERKTYTTLLLKKQ